MNSTWVEQMRTETGSHWENRQRQADEIDLPVTKLIKIAKAANEYYDHIFENDIAEWAQLAYVSFIDQLLKEHNKKVIWLPCFYHSFQAPHRSSQDEIYFKAMKTRMIATPFAPGITGQIAGTDLCLFYLPASGPSINIPLSTVSELELKQQNLNDAEIHHALHNDQRCNHFNDENNINMSNLIINIINNDDFAPEVIKIEEYFPKINFNGIATVR